jgi:hypothetical protein
MLSFGLSFLGSIDESEYPRGYVLFEVRREKVEWVRFHAAIGKHAAGYLRVVTLFGVDVHDEGSGSRRLE